MEKTKNYNLNKPSPEDFYNIGDFNQNADLLDTELKNHADRLVKKADLVNGKVPEGQLPSYVSAVSEYASRSAFPSTGKANIIYIAIDTGICYRWGGTQYVIISDTIALGETAQTAYRGDRGKIAYDHSVKMSGNPHNVTKSDVGLGNLDNTSDVDKPVSTAVQTALNAKVDKVSGKGLSTNDFTAAYKTKLDNAPTDINSVLSNKGNVFAKRVKNVTVAVNTWISDSTFADYPYKADIMIAGITEADWKVSDMYTADEARETLAPDVLAGNGFVRIWSEAVPDHAITFDSIDVTKVVV